MGLIRDRNRTWVVRKRVPERLREPVARVLDNSKAQQQWLQKSTRTKDKAEAKRIAVGILADFDKTLVEAETLLVERPLRTALTQSEIDQLAAVHYASVLAGDEEFTADAQADEDVARAVATQLDTEGIEYDPPAPFETQRPYGLTDRQVAKRNGNLDWWLENARKASARGDISIVSEALTELLDRAHINLDPTSLAYRKLGMAVLKADVRAHEALEKRYRGEPIDTPPMAHLEPSSPARSARPSDGNTLQGAFAGWKKERERSSSTVAEYERAVSLFTQLHGAVLIVAITKRHALTFREALQDIPRSRPKELAQMTLPQLVEWRRSHPDVKCLTPGTVNKLLGGVQAIATWAFRNGLVPDDVRWSDPFAEMKLPPSDEQGGGPFTLEELRTLFSSAVFTAGERPEAGQGNVAFWLPLLALFSGARRSELTRRCAADVSKDEATGQWVIAIHSDRAKGQKLKTLGSARIVPIHPELVRLGFLDFVETTQQGDDEAQLFPAVSSEKSANAWTHWFGRYLDKLGIGGGGKGLHSLRHNFTDALRQAGGVPEDLIDALTGHAVHSVGRSYGARARHPKLRHRTIVDRYGMPLLIENVGKVRYTSIDFQAVRWRVPEVP